MYMTYFHEHGIRPPAKIARPLYDPEDPFTKNRTNPPAGGRFRPDKKKAPQSTPKNIIRLEAIHLHIQDKSTLQAKAHVLGPMMALRALSGETQGGGGRNKLQGVEITRGRVSIQNWVRTGHPAGAKVELKGQPMWDFLGSLTECVLPRIRDFEGFPIPKESATTLNSSSISGVVAVGLKPAAFGFFPQIEVNQEMYPKPYGMYIHFVTSAEGQGAQESARALLSGLQVPFLRTGGQL